MSNIYIYPGSSSIKIKYYRLMGYNCKFYGISQEEKGIEMPPSKYFYKYSAEARDQVENYFSKYFHSSKLDPLLLSYIKKYVIMSYPDFYAFMKSTTSSSKKPLVLSPYFFSDIYNNCPPKFRFNIFFVFFVSQLISIKQFLRSLYFSFISDKKDLPDIVYIRKKVYPDLGIGDLIGENFLNTNIKYEKIFWAFSKHKNKIGFDFLNNYRGSTKRTIISFIQALFHSFKDFYFFSRYLLPARYYLNLQTESYISRNFINLDVKVFCGNLVDKPFYVLLSRYKKNEQLICSINESFFYPPYRSFDYNHLDVYYAMNEIDQETINVNGGDIKEYKFVEFFRKKLITNSKGLSDSIIKTIKDYKKTILVTTIQSPHNLYTQWSPNDLCEMISKIFDLSKDMPKHLFIIKGKKGELNYLSKEMRDNLEKQHNIFIIDSTKPRFLEKNQFEDLIRVSDLLISMSHTSTTIWQFISKGKPAIGINQNHPPSFLRNYKFFEVKLDMLNQAVNYWLDMEKTKWDDICKNISKKVNLGNGKGLQQVGIDLKNRINNAKV